MNYVVLVGQLLRVLTGDWGLWPVRTRTASCAAMARTARSDCSE
jgi:hypothetical protein